MFRVKAEEAGVHSSVCAGCPDFWIIFYWFRKRELSRKTKIKPKNENRAEERKAKRVVEADASDPARYGKIGSKGVSMQITRNDWTAPLSALLAAGLGALIVYLSNTGMLLFELFIFVPFTTLLLSEGRLWAGLSYLLFALVMWAMDGWPFALSLLVRIAVFSFAMGILIQKGKPTFHELALPALLFALLIGAMLLLDQWLSGGQTLALLEQVMTDSSNAVLEQLKQRGADAALLTNVEIFMSDLRKNMLLFMPGLFYLSGLMTSMITSAVSRELISKTDRPVARFKLYSFVIHRKIAVILIALVLITLGAGMNAPAAAGLGGSVAIAVGGLFSLHGLARIDGWLALRKVSGTVRLLLYVVAAFLFAPSFLLLFPIGLVSALMIPPPPEHQHSGVQEGEDHE